MGFFSEIASETRRSMACEQTPTSTRQTTAKPLSPAATELKTDSSVTVPTPAMPESSSTPDMQKPSPAPEQPEQQSVQPAIDLTRAADAADDAERRKIHEAAEAKRKAEFDAKQAAKQAARQEQIDRIIAMSDEDVAADAVKRVGADTERLTRRNMKEAVCEHIQALCRRDAAFARRTMLPEKSMINCFRYIYRMAQEYAEQEMKDQGIGHTGVYGCDVPDGLCYQWAEDYFNTDNVKEDHKDDEKFVPKPYVPAGGKKAQSKSKAAQKSSGTAKSRAGKASAAQGDSMEQISLI